MHTFETRGRAARAPKRPCAVAASHLSGELRFTNRCFGRTESFLTGETFQTRESGVALRFPPQSKTSLSIRRFPAVFQWLRMIETAPSFISVIILDGNSPVRFYMLMRVMKLKNSPVHETMDARLYN
jgi:hypothetical protein